MRKIYGSIFLLSLLVSCSKNTENPSNNVVSSAEIAAGVTIKNDKVVTKDIASYEKMIESVNEETLRKNIEATGFVSMEAFITNPAVQAKYGKVPTDEQKATFEEHFKDTKLALLLNPDGVIQIERWFIRVDPLKEKVFVLDTAKVEDYPDLLSGDVNISEVSWYGTDVDILELLANNGQVDNGKIDGLFCKDGSAKGSVDKDKNQSAGDGYRMNCKLAYEKYGIYFVLKVDLEHQKWNPVPGVWTNTPAYIGATYDVYGQGRCGKSGVDAYEQCYNNLCVSLRSRFSYKLYERSRALKNYTATAKFYTIDGQLYKSRSFKIKKG